MKTPKQIKQKIEKMMFKKTIDGILSIAVRMFYAQDEVKDCADFFVRLINDTPDAFYERPIIPAKEADFLTIKEVEQRVHD